MKASNWTNAWDDFFFRPTPAYSLGLFRIAFSAVLLVCLALLIPDLSVWYSETGPLPVETARQTLGGTRINFLSLLPQSEVTVQAFFGILIVATTALMVGYRTRVAAVAVWFLLTSLHHRNLFILNSGDTFLRDLSFFLMLAPADRAFSIDRWLRRRRGQEAPGVPLIRPWAQRLLQIQVCVLYASTVLSKSRGTAWMNGTAVFTVMQLDEFRHYPIPLFVQPLVHSLWFSKLATWSTLAVELSMGTLVWIRRLKYPILCAGVALHLGLEYTMNVPVFQWAVLSTYLLFLDAAVVGKVIALDLPVEAQSPPVLLPHARDRSSKPGRRAA